MPIHYMIDKFKLEGEIELLKNANKKITHIIPELIETTHHMGRITHYMIIFEDRK